MTSSENIILIGFMGSGKTTMGKKLAKKLGKKFIDLDHEIERDQSCSISEIFENEGEEYFRKLERKKVTEIPPNQNLVISSGGGTPCFFDNMDQLNGKGVTVFLKLTPQQTLSRVRSGLQQRPLLAEKTELELLQFVTETFRKRMPFYEKAKHTIDAFSLSEVDIINKILVNKDLG